jgi:hypothetical protein
MSYHSDAVSVVQGESGWSRSPNSATDWWHVSGLSLTDSAIYHALCRYANRQSPITLSAIGRALGCKRQTVADSVRRLHEARWVHAQQQLQADGQWSRLRVTILSPQLALQHALVSAGKLSADVQWPADLTDTGAWEWVNATMATVAGDVRETDGGCPLNGRGVSAKRTP